METELVVSENIAEEGYADFMHKHFGAMAIVAEAKIFSFMRYLSPDYVGGQWDAHALSNNGLYLSPRGDKFKIDVPTNGFSGVLTADAAGVVATLFALCILAEKTENECYVERYHALRVFAASHQEARLIFRAID